jgi:PKHD-type hydroxylase
MWANNEGYRFHLSGLGEPIGYLKYTPKTDAKPAGHYNWHQDFGGGPYALRKLSMVIQLSKPTDYKGCRLVLCNDGPCEVPFVEAGDAILFPSWTPLCVTEIEEGAREALVVWITGPQFQ